MPQLENVQHETFCHEYLVDFNGTQAAIRAGYKDGSGIRSKAYDLLTKTDIQRRVQELHVERVNAIRLDEATVLRELLRIATCDLGQAFNPEGGLKPIHEIPEDVRRAMSGIEVEEIWEGRGEDKYQAGVIKKVKFWDKPKAIELLGKKLQLWVDRLEVNHLITLETLVMGEIGNERRVEGSDVVSSKAIGPGNN